jgi:hypothetical protein
MPPPKPGCFTFQNWRLSTQVRAPGHSASAPCPSRLGAYLAKRSQVVTDLANQIQDHACRGDAPPVWAAAGSHPSTALIGEITVWRAASGINPQDPRPTGGTQFETLPALWKQRLDRDIARSTDSSGTATNDRQHTPHLDAGMTTAGARTKHPVSVRTGQPHPAANRLSSCCAEGLGLPNSVVARSHGSDCRIGLYQDQGPGYARPTARVLAPLRAASCQALNAGVRQGCWRVAGASGGLGTD